MHKKLGFVFALLLVVVVPTMVYARNTTWQHYTDTYTKHSYKNTSSYSLLWGTQSSSALKSTKTAVVKVATTSTQVLAHALAGSETALAAYVTGYSYWDNTPPGSGDISNPVVHTNAGGTGTYADPITLAVGHSITNGKDVLDYPEGTRFYLPYLQKYAIVEDTCGDGRTPQNGPCHTGYKGYPWIDIYVDGKASRSSADSCMDKITGVHAVIKDPVSTYPVSIGSITEAGCLVQ